MLTAITVILTVSLLATGFVLAVRDAFQSQQNRGWSWDTFVIAAFAVVMAVGGAIILDKAFEKIGTQAPTARYLNTGKD